MKARVEKGSPGQFEVFADGERIAGRSKSLLDRLVGGGWPDESEVIAAVRGRHG